MEGGTEYTVLRSAEEWRSIPGYAGRYQASTLGRIRRLRHTKQSGSYRTYTLSEKMILGHSDKRGYLVTRLGDRQMVKIHRAVYSAFYGRIPDGVVIRHLNGRPWDNRLINLASGTQHDNNLDTYAYGGKIRRFSASDVTAIRERLSKGESKRSIADDLGVSRTAIHRIHKGLTFGWLKEPS
jgi:hypothetical protein